MDQVIAMAGMRTRKAPRARGSPTAGRGSPTAGNGSPAAGNGSPTSGNGSPTVDSRAWLEWNGHSLVGRGRLALLELIAEQGSISAAAREMHVSYRAAWRWIDEMNGVAEQPLVVTATGGKGGGGAVLTPLGKALLEAMRLLQERLAEFNGAMNAELARYFASLPLPRRKSSRS